MWAYQKTSNRQIKNAYIEWLKSNTTHLWQVYGRYSQAKQIAYERCMDECISMGGKYFRIISANTMQFTCGWVAYDEQGLKRFYYITASNNRYMPLETINKIDGTVTGTVTVLPIVSI